MSVTLSINGERRSQSFDKRQTLLSRVHNNSSQDEKESFNVEIET